MGLFGSITRTLFGGSKQTSKSGNNFGDQLNSQFSPYVATGAGGLGQAANVLGVGSNPDQGGQGLQDFFGSSGGNFLLNQGMDNVDAFYRAKGLGQSGAEAKGLEDYRSGLASTKLQDYLGNLFNLGQAGLGAGGVIANAGQFSQGKETSSKGMGSFLGALLASDRRLKTDIVKLGEEADGLGRYRFRYRDSEFVHEGVMADEVERLRPWALGPRVGGYATVDYSRL